MGRDAGGVQKVHSPASGRPGVCGVHCGRVFQRVRCAPVTQPGPRPGLSLVEGLLGYFVPFYPRGSLQSNLGKGQLSELRSVKGVRDLVVAQIKGLCAIAEHNLPMTVITAWLSNAMLDEDGTIRIADYGFVTPSESLGTMTVSRTAAFEAPEILRGDVTFISEPAVVYAFGMSLFELLTGATPFSDLSNALEVAMAVMGGERPDQDVRPELRASPEVGVLVRIVEMCWADDWEVRPAFSDLLAQLQPESASAPASAASIGAHQ